MFLIGVIASGISGHLTPPYSSSYESIYTGVGTGSSSTITFNSIPSTYTHLQVRCSLKGGSSYMGVTFNSDSTSNHYVSSYVEGITTGSNATSAPAIYVFDSVSPSTLTGAAIIDIQNYSNSNHPKTLRSFQGSPDYNTAGIAWGVWKYNTTISSITFTIGAGTFSAGTSIALYGLKG